MSGEDYTISTVKQREWQLIPLGENNPGAGSGSGVLRYYVVANGVFTYTANITVNASVYCAGGTNNSHANSTVPYGASYPHDIVYKVRWNTTHAYNSTGTKWELDWVRGNITSPYHGLTDQGLTEYHIVNNSNFMWVHYVRLNEVIARGANSTQNLISIYAYF